MNQFIFTRIFWEEKGKDCIYFWRKFENLLSESTDGTEIKVQYEWDGIYTVKEIDVKERDWSDERNWDELLHNCYIGIYEKADKD